MTMWGHAMRRRAVVCGAISAAIAVVAALVLTFSPGAPASAAPSPRSTCTSSVHTAAGTTCAGDPGTVAAARLADTGFPAIALAITGAFVLGCGLLFVTVGRRRRN